MKVKVEYLVMRHIEIEIPDELANEYEDAHVKDDYDRTDSVVDKIDDYVRDTLPQIDTEYAFDWWDWEVID